MDVIIENQCRYERKQLGTSDTVWLIEFVSFPQEHLTVESSPEKVFLDI